MYSFVLVNKTDNAYRGNSHTCLFAVLAANYSYLILQYYIIFRNSSGRPGYLLLVSNKVEIRVSNQG